MCSSGFPGEQHRKQRKMLVPAFSIKHLREMTPIFFQVAGKVFRSRLSLRISLTPLYFTDSFEMGSRSRSKGLRRKLICSVGWAGRL